MFMELGDCADALQGTCCVIIVDPIKHILPSIRKPGFILEPLDQLEENIYPVKTTST